MAKFIVDGSVLECDQGTTQSTLTVISNLEANAEHSNIATMMDFVPLVCIKPFGICRKQGNVSCVPATLPWEEYTLTTKVNGFFAITEDSVCPCNHGGLIRATDTVQQNFTTS